MTTSKVAVAGGILILIGGLALAFYTGTNGAALVAAKAKAVEKYVALAEKSLSSGDLSKAEKYAKEALVVDPKNKKALSEFKKIALASCPKVAAAPAANNGAAEGTKAKAAPAAATPAAKPAAPQAEEDEEMGCI
ncbi:hypothetical protein [Nitratifractor salsuginis]|uniref:Uncharacterized protein n=1 Tax=Nitratifractor salsuginis (strain DSM 16511 / JCM 12458 / E9I37-1) TaxID=749222 RepID=E6WZ91_NITSE|nr:hypothetical protein [Nitratifractor salsuginis]ADV46603.1 hypothetical protein Nitsa_1352 [Nitratifractor salsuginis DSM 16511]